MAPFEEEGAYCLKLMSVGRSSVSRSVDQIGSAQYIDNYLSQSLHFFHPLLSENMTLMIFCSLGQMSRPQGSHVKINVN